MKASGRPSGESWTKLLGSGRSRSPPAAAGSRQRLRLPRAGGRGTGHPEQQERQGNPGVPWNCAGSCAGPPRPPTPGAGPRRRQRLGELRRRREPVGRKLLQRGEHRGLDVGWDRVPLGGERSRCLRHHLGHDGLRGGAGERRVPGQHLVGHGAQRVDVRAAGRWSGSPIPVPGSCSAACRAIHPGLVSGSRADAVLMANAIPKSATSAPPSRAGCSPA